MKVPRIVVVGSVNTDMVVKGQRLPAPGETVTGGRFVMVAGGKGANQAVAAARLGAEVTLVAKLGGNVFGNQAVENFRREGIHTEWLLRDPEHATGVALILVDRAGENLISVAAGANAALTPAEVDQAGECIRAADVVDAPVGNSDGCGVPGGADCGRRGRAGDPRPGPRGPAARAALEAPRLRDPQRKRGRAADRHRRQRRGHGGLAAGRLRELRPVVPSHARRPRRSWPTATA